MKRQKVVRKHKKLDLWMVRVLKFDPKAEPEKWAAYKERNPEAILVKTKPSQRTLERWAYDSVAKTPCGCKVEPDGKCPHGVPSWLIILGFI